MKTSGHPILKRRNKNQVLQCGRKLQTTGKQSLDCSAVFIKILICILFFIRPVYVFRIEIIDCKKLFHVRLYMVFAE